VTSPTDAYFDELSRRGHVPALRNRQAKIRFDVDRDKHIDRWVVLIDKGDIGVSAEAPSSDPADCVIRADQNVFDDVFTGRTNAMAAMLRGALLADGDPELLVETRHLLPVVDERRQS
jgi:putative sterol carrier protein